MTSVKYRSVVLAVAGLLSTGVGLSKGLDSEAAVQRAMERGTTMFWFDRAAWVTSDDLTARLPVARHSEIGGWIVTPLSRGYHVDYFGQGSHADNVIYSADVDGGNLSHQTVYPLELSPILKTPALRMAHALTKARAEIAKRSEWKACAPANFNTVVLPPDDNGSISVYFLTPQTENGSFPFGGHYRVDIATDGNVVDARAFTRSCITMKKKIQASGAEPEALFLTHLLDPQPTEIHVFEPYAVGVPVFVGIATTNSLWKVDKGQIELVKEKMEQETKASL